MPHNILINVYVLGRLSHVLLFATLWTVPTRLLCLRDSPGKNTGVACHALLQGISPPRDLNYSSANLIFKSKVFQA